MRWPGSRHRSWSVVLLWVGAVRDSVLGEFRIPFPELIVRDVTVDAVIVQVLHVGFIGVTGVGGNDDDPLIYAFVNPQALITACYCFQHRL
jgi:hypothetical protein